MSRSFRVRHSHYASDWLAILPGRHRPVGRSGEQNSRPLLRSRGLRPLPPLINRREMLVAGGAAALAASACAAPTIASTWESLASSYRVPDWFRDAKFGICAHL